MSYTSYEESDYAGAPQELYRFAMGDRLWLYTSADAPVYLNEDEYVPIYIRRSGFTKGGDARKSSIEIEMAASNDVASLFRTGWLASIMIVTIYRHHYGDDEFSILWKGRITGCKWSGSVATLASDSVFTLFQRAGLRRVYQVGCPHVLYGAACGVSADDYRVEATVSEVSGSVVTLSDISGFGSGYFLAGMFKFGDEIRMIMAHDEDEITLIDGIAGLGEASSVSLWPGCARSVSTCRDKFENLDNYGGLPFLPEDNPFSGDALV